MPVTSSSIRDGIDKIVANLPNIQSELNGADAKLGDGDTGLMFSRILHAFATVEHRDDLSVSDYCMRLAQAGAKTTGSSFGTLIVASLMAIAKSTKGQDAIYDNELGSIVAIARDAMMARGKTELGSKTAIDSLNHIANALQNAKPDGRPAIVAGHAAQQAIDEFKMRACKVGRARMFAQKSKGLDDPGMLAVALALDAIARL